MTCDDLVSVVVDLVLLILAGVLSFRWVARSTNRWQGLIRGGIAGTVVGIAAALTLGIAFTLLHPEDPSAGSVAIVGIMTAPVGFAVGAVIGTCLVLRRTGKSQSDSG